MSMLVSTTKMTTLLMVAFALTSAADATTINQVSRIRPLATAASGGIYGFRLGMGITSFNRRANANTPPPEMLRKISLAKGLSLPINVGAILSLAPEARMTQFSTYVQWSFFERFLWPALAFRFALGRMTSGEHPNVWSTSYGLVSSWGMSSTTIYTLASLQTNKFTGLDKIHLDPAIGAGVELSLIPGFMTVASEVDFGQQGLDTFSLKIALGM